MWMNSYQMSVRCTHEDDSETELHIVYHEREFQTQARIQ